ncbi:MAG: hydantoinase/oxoprolinase family protein [Deltaproteobacteria bacterium]|nr:MAG: hydantoinase/oxoprolinase family protein [Deltaproteobacteria bacterium]
MVVIGVDTGGTFTDFVYKEGSRWGIYKVLSTPSSPATAVLRELQQIGWEKKKQITHGTTVATNAILERKGSKTALITNKGFEDIVEIGRQNRSRMYDLAYRKEPHLVSSGLRFGVAGRTLSTGEELEPFDVAGAQEVILRLRELEVQSVAVCFLFSFINPAHEQKIGRMLGKTGVSVSLSHQILAEFREFERASTTVVNAYVSPKIQEYIGILMEGLDDQDRLAVMQSNGGSISARTAMKEPVRTILSGPAGGAVGALEIGRMAGHTKLIGLDMGGTSTDVCLIDNSLSLTVESQISGYPVKVPMIDIHTVGAGGGSIASLDVGGSLKVGPESAGADPGPICYGKGDQITVTDANLYLGRLIPEHFLGGTMKLRRDRIEDHFQRMAKEANLSAGELAEGILAVANATMEKAIRVISVERGHDPREFGLFAFGGAGGMHAAFLARLLSIPSVLVPQNPGILSAMGMLMADTIKDYSLTVMRNELNASYEELSALFLELERQGLQDLKKEGFAEEHVRFHRYLDMRYQGQSHEIVVPFTADYVASFHNLHEKSYGYRNVGKVVETVNIRLRACSTPDKPQFQKTKEKSAPIATRAILGDCKVTFDQEITETKIFARDKLSYGNKINGPAIVTEYSSTIVIPPFARAFVDEYSNILLEIME